MVQLASSVVCLWLIIYTKLVSKLCISVTVHLVLKEGQSKPKVSLHWHQKDKFVKINRYVFRNRGRNYIQRATVNKALKLIHNFL